MALNFHTNYLNEYISYSYRKYQNKISNKRNNFNKEVKSFFEQEVQKFGKYF